MKESATLLCNALILSRVDYCCSLLAGATKETMTKLQRVLNLAARITTRSPRHAHVTPVLRELQWLPVDSRVTMRLAVMVQCGRAPDYLSKCIITYLPRRALRSSCTSAITLCSGSAPSRVGSGAWSVAGPSVWNSLPARLREPDIGLDTFGVQLQDYLLTISDSPS